MCLLELGSKSYLCVYHSWDMLKATAVMPLKAIFYHDNEIIVSIIYLSKLSHSSNTYYNITSC